MRRDPTEFRERFQRWKNGEQVYDKGQVIKHAAVGIDKTYDVGSHPVFDSLVVTPHGATFPSIQNAVKTKLEYDMIKDLGLFDDEDDKQDYMWHSMLNNNANPFFASLVPHYGSGKDARKLEYHPEGDYYYGGNLFGKGNELVVKGKASPKLYMHPWKTERDLRQEQNEYHYSQPQKEGWKKDLESPLSPVDPVGEFVVGNAVINPAFKYLFGGVGKEVLDEGLIQLGKRGNKWARAKSFYRAAGDPEIVENIRFDIPKQHKQKYPTKVKYSLDRNYKNPIKNILSSQQQDAMRGKYIGHGAERTVFEDKRYPNRVIKIGGGLNADEKITDFDGLNEAIDYTLEINKLPGVEPITYEGFSESNGIFTPWFSQKRVTPFQKVADPWETLTKHYVLPNGKKVNTGKLSRIRMIDTDKAFRPLGYEPDVRNVGRFYVKNYPYTVGDLGQKNIGIDEIGRLRIFDPLIDL